MYLKFLSNGKNKDEDEYKNIAIKYRELSIKSRDYFIEKLLKKIAKKNISEYCFGKIMKEIRKVSKKGNSHIRTSISMKEFRDPRFKIIDQELIVQEIQKKLYDVGYNSINRINRNSIVFRNEVYSLFYMERETTVLIVDF